MGRMKVDVLDEFTKAAPAVRNCRIVATLEDGTEQSAHRVVTLEEIERGTPDAVLEAKFEQLTRHHLPRERRRAVIDGAWRLDECHDVREVIDLTLL
jgi:hypothetical protein